MYFKMKYTWYKFIFATLQVQVRRGWENLPARFMCWFFRADKSTPHTLVFTLHFGRHFQNKTLTFKSDNVQLEMYHITPLMIQVIQLIDLGLDPFGLFPVPYLGYIIAYILLYVKHTFLWISYIYTSISKRILKYTWQ